MLGRLSPVMIGVIEHVLVCVIKYYPHVSSKELPKIPRAFCHCPNETLAWKSSDSDCVDFSVHVAVCVAV